MNKQFWRALADQGFEVPIGQSVVELTPELLVHLGLADSELRELSFSTLGEWIGRGLYGAEDLRQMGGGLLSNLREGIGEKGTDTVFLRSFSSLVLGKIVDHDAEHSFLSEPEIGSYLDAGLAFLSNERDLRGFVPEKGWIHTAAHAGDLLAALAKNPKLSARSLGRLLGGIAAKMVARVEHVYLRLEDERLAYAAMSALRRGLLDEDFLRDWVDRLAQPPGYQAWIDLIEGSQAEVSAWHNTRCFLRTLYFQLSFTDRPPPAAPVVMTAIEDALKAMDRGFYELA